MPKRERKARTWRAWAVVTDYDKLVCRVDGHDGIRGVYHVYRSRKHAVKFVRGARDVDGESGEVFLSIVPVLVTEIIVKR